jgi:uncharacterized alpha-E superfamily protein
MLSRVADNLYWMSRYLERAEHTARLVDVSLYHLLGEQTDYAAQRWKRLYDSLRVAAPEQAVDDAYSVTQSLVFDTTNTSSIVSCISSARENAQQVRERISSEMWEQLNSLYLKVKHANMEDMWFTAPHDFLTTIKEGVQLFQGLTDSTMSNDEGWHFIQVGRYIERTWATSALIDVHFRTSSLVQQSEQTDSLRSDHLDYLEWVGLLRSCSAFQAYCAVYTASIYPERIAEFLLFNTEFPRSIHFAIDMLQRALHSIAKATNARRAQRIERLVGRLSAALDYDQVEDIIEDIHSYLENIQQQCTQIHNAIYQTYIFYPVDVALSLEGASQS